MHTGQLDTDRMFTLALNQSFCNPKFFNPISHDFQVLLNRRSLKL
ncbi:Uncharacterised protein [Vibrio cholerae]|nr:Uncharacterised protein [Vibrio cholerae]